MPSSRKVKAKAKATALSASDVASVAKDNPYIQRLIDDGELRENLRTAADSTRSAFNRLANGKAPTKALLEDKKLQNDLRRAATAARDATQALTDAPNRGARKGLKLGRVMLLAGLGGAAALVANEKLRSKVLDTLFGAEEEFEYSPPAGGPPPAPAAPVSAA